MKDIDFDELDRAVSSLMGAVPSDKDKPADTTSDSTSTPAEPADTGAPSDDVAVTSSSQTDDTGDSTSTNSAPLPSPIISLIEPTEKTDLDSAPVEEVETFTEAMQLVEESPAVAPTPSVRRGRFMDVVRPSVRDVAKPMPSRAVSRQGVSLQPSPGRTEEPTAEPARVSSYSDTPLEGHADIEEAFAVEDTAPSEAASVLPEYNESEAPLSSPFLPDAKVEKRPLGRPAETAPIVDLATELAASTDEVETIVDTVAVEETESSDADAQLPAQPLPPELGSELLTIETSAFEASQPAQPAAVKSEPAAATTPASVSEPVRVVTGVSIPQQYKVQPQQSVEEAPSGAIYDAQPLVHSAEKKSSWLWKLVAIIAIALLGAGGGAAIYYLGLI